MSNKIEDILAQCIEDIRAGRSSIDDCLAKYPSVSKELEPLLRITLEIREPPDVKPSTAFKVRARVQLMEQIHAMRGVTKWPWFRYTGQRKPITYKRRFNMIGIIVAIVLAVSAAGGGTVYASQGSLPGGFLYPVKLGTEQVRLILADDATDAELWLEFASTRIEEMTALAEKGRPENLDIAVNGYDEAMAKAIEKMEAASGKGLGIADISEEMALAASIHGDVLAGLLDPDTDPTVPEEAEGGITQAIQVSMSGYGNAVLALAGENPVRAMEINLSAMEGSLNRAKAKAEENDIEGVEGAVAEFVQLSGFGLEISAIAEGLGEDPTALQIQTLVTAATAIHSEVLDWVLLKLGDLENVPDQAKEAILEAIEATGAIDDVPPVDTPPDAVPPDDAPPDDTPPVETPPIETPPVETSPVDIPPVETPPVDIPPTDDE
jgi:hypothetical protein